MSYLKVRSRKILAFGGLALAMLCTAYCALSPFSIEKGPTEAELKKDEIKKKNELELKQVSENPQAVLKSSAEFRAQNPRLLQNIPLQKVPAGLPNLHAATCGACHQEIYKEWQISTHALAWEGDPQFLAEVEKNNRGEKKAGWVCMNCHTPLENQQPQLVVDVKEGRLDRPIFKVNPAYDAVLEKEAITCASCHVREGVIHGPFGNTNAPHATVKDEKMLQSNLCTQCHQAMGNFPKEDLMCAFSTGEEHLASPQGIAGETCQSCHMPKIERSLVAGGPIRKTRRHFFMGSLLPKKYSDAAAIDGVRHLFKQGLEVEMPDKLLMEEGNGKQIVVVKYRNEFAGHLLPTGDPERFLIVSAIVTSKEGEVLAAQKERIGTVYEWYPVAQKLSDNRLKPKEERTLKLSFIAKKEVLLHVKVVKGRITMENLKYHQLQDAVVGEQVIFDEVKLLGR